MWKTLKVLLISIRTDLKKWIGVSADGEGRTIFQILTGRNKRPTESFESNVYNPLNLKVGEIIECEPFKQWGTEVRFVVESITARTIPVLKKDYRSATYNLRTAEGHVVDHRIRVIETRTGFKSDGVEYLIERIDEQFGCDNEFIKNVLCDPSGEIVAGDEVRYWRIGGVYGAYIVNCKILEDCDGDGYVDSSEITTSFVKMWDYHRSVATSAGDLKEYLTVEQDQATLYMRLWIGRDASPGQIIAYGRPK